MTTSRETVNIPKLNLTKAKAFKVIGWIVVAAGLVFLFLIDFINFFSISLIIAIGLLFIRKGKQLLCRKRRCNPGERFTTANTLS